MPSKHQEAPSFVRKKFFEGIKSFQDFEARTEQLSNTKEVAEQWEGGFAALQKFHKREGHCLVPTRREEFGQNLGSWVGTQRSRKESLTPDQIKRLNGLGFSWDPFAEL